MGEHEQQTLPFSIPVVPEKCVLDSLDLVVLTLGCNHSYYSASPPPDVCSSHKYTPLFHSAHRLQVAALLLFQGLVVSLGPLCLFGVKEIIIFGKCKSCRV